MALKAIAENFEFENLSEYNFQDATVINEAFELFDKFEADGFLIRGNFDDDTWTFSKDDIRHLFCNLDFQGISSRHIKKAVKCWAVFQLHKNTPVTVQKAVNRLNQLIQYTNDFDTDKLENLIQWVEDAVPISERRLAVSTLLNFIDFAQLPSAEEYFNELSFGTKKLSYNGDFRTLPKYDHVLMFQYVIEDFASKWSDSQKLFYYPVYLWWKITTVIPMRISEFCSLKRNSLITEETRLLLMVPRKKQRATRSDHVEVTDRIEISAELAKAIDEYLKLSEPYGKTHTLLSYKAFKTFIGNDSYNNGSYSFTKGNFRRLLDYFYTDVVGGMYQITDVERIKPNDTRHFAFCSMMLQGMNPLTIARIGGHRTIESQFHYQQHLEYFTQSQVYHLTRINKLQTNQHFTHGSSALEIEDALVNSLQPKSKFPHLVEMEIGYCTDPQMNCESDICQLCSKWYIPREELKEKRMQLEDFTSQYKYRIEERLKTMERLRKDLEFNPLDNTFDPAAQEALSREARLLRGEIVDLARIQTLLDKE